MPIPNSIDELKPAAADNYPAGSEPVFPSLDDYLRAHAAFIAQNRDSIKEGLDGVEDDLQKVREDAVDAIAMADTYTSVPVTYKSWMIAVTQPHLRVMFWNGTKYVRAPFHRPGDIHFALPNVTTWPGALPLRSDLVWNKADYPDLAELLGVTGATFTLAEARGRVLRALDNGAGFDPGRAWASLQNDAMREIEGSTGTLYGNSDARLGLSGSSSGALKANTSVSTQITSNALVGVGFQGVTSISFKASDAGVPIASEIRMKNIAFNIFVDY